MAKNHNPTSGTPDFDDELERRAKAMAERFRLWASGKFWFAIAGAAAVGFFIGLLF